MLNNRFLFTFALAFSLAGFASAAFVTVSAVNGPFVNDANIFIIANVYDNNGGAKSNVDLNMYDVNSTGAYFDANYFGSVQGTVFNNIIIPSARGQGDFNVVVTDLNDNVSATVKVTIVSSKGATVSWPVHSPPFRQGVESITFSLLGKNSANADTNMVLRARLVADANGSEAAPPFDVNANGSDQNTFSTTGLGAGLYYIDVNRGLSVFPVTLYKFKGYLNFQNDSNSVVTTFGQGKTVFMIAKATNFDGNTTQPISSVSLTVTKPSGDSNSSIPCDINSFATCRYFITSDANSGDYQVSGTITTTGGDTLSVKRVFSMKTYRMEFYTKTFSGGGQRQEKMPSVYPANSTVSFEQHFIRTTDSNELAGPDLNNTFCSQPMNFFIQAAGKKDQNTITPTVSWSSSNPNYCLVTLTAPSVQGSYIITARTTGSQPMIKSTILNVQNFLIFLTPVVPGTFDPNSPSGKFGFYKGDKVGFRPNYVDLNGSLNPQIVAVNNIQVFQGNTTSTFTGVDANWQTDKNIVVLSANAVNQLSGGFVPLKVNVDVNTNNSTLNSGVTAFGMFKLNVFNMTAALASDGNGTAISANFGPPSVRPDQNIFAKISATRGGGSGISGATVTLISLRNADQWNDASVNSLASGITDSNGNSVLNIGSLSSFGLRSGRYDAKFYVSAPDGNADTVDMFFESRRFVTFAQPLDTTTGAACNFLQAQRPDQNASFILKGFDPNAGFSAGDINILVPANASIQVFYMGTPTKPQFPPVLIPSVNYDVNAFYPCFSFGQFGSNQKNFTKLTLRKGDNTNWRTGFYNISIPVTDINGNLDSTQGFMNVQSFGFLVNPAAIGQFGPPTGKPGSTFDMNVTVLGASSDVNVTAKLVDPNSGNMDTFSENGNTAASDLNIGLKNGTGFRPGSQDLDCNSSSYCPAKGIVVRSGTTYLDQNTISVIIPANAKVQDYMVMLTATDTSGNQATGQVFVHTQLYNLVNFGFFSNLYGVEGVQNQIPQNWTTTGRTIDQTYQFFPMMGGGGGPGGQAPPTLDFNFAVNYSARQLYFDSNRVGSTITSSGDNNFSAGQSVWEAVRVATVGTDINGGMYRITDISKVGTQNPGIKFIRKSALDTTASQFSYLGVYPTDVNFYVPVLIKNPDGTSASNINVIVSNIALFTPGSYSQTNLAAASCTGLSQLQSCTVSNDFNSWNAVTDANGFALLPLRIAKPGSNLQLEITIYNSGATQTQRFQPFQGPIIDVKKFVTSTTIAGPTFTVLYNYNRTGQSLPDQNVTLDLNRTIGGYFIAGGVAGSSIGFIRGLSGFRSGVLGDINADRNWYLVPVDGNTIVIDDDRNITVLAGGPGTSESTTQDGNVAGNGAFPPLVCSNDLNSGCFGLTGQTYVANGGTGGGTGDSGIYLQRDSTIKSSAISSSDTNFSFYPVYTNAFNPMQAPSKDANIQIVVSLTNLSGVTDTTTSYTVSNPRLESFTSFTQRSIPSANIRGGPTGTTIINVGKPSDLGLGQGFYDVAFNLTVGSSTTEERASFQVRN